MSAAILILGGCRVPEPPVFKDKSRGIVYDTAMEESLRNRTAHSLIQTTYEPYIDTLSEPVAVTQWSDTECHWDVFVGTNRGVWDESERGPHANRVLDHPRYGRADVRLPRGAQSKRSSRSIVPVAWRKNSSPEVAAEVDAGPLSEDEFLTGIREQLARSRQGDLLLFVHGFNVGFDDAVLCTARMAMKMPFNGAVVTYAWPSQGGISNYDEDEPINKASVAPFTEFLQTLRAGVPEETRITIVVHSMGNRIVMDALNQLPAPTGKKPIAQVVLCAPDVGRSDFNRWAPGVLAQSERVALYTNASDTALIASKGLHSESRAGDAWEPVIVPGIEVVDCSRIDLTLMGHSYFSDNRDVLTDLFMLVKEQRPADRRPHLERRTTAAGDEYWSFHCSAGNIHCDWHFDDEPGSP